MGLGIVGLGVGAFFGMRAIGKLDDADRHCDATTCDKEGLELRDESETQANLSTVVFAVSAAALAGGVVLWLTAPSSKSVALTRNGLALRF